MSMYPSRTKRFKDQKYPCAIAVLVTTTVMCMGVEYKDTFMDGIKGLNVGHAMYLARENWVDAQIDYVGVYIDEYV